MQISRDGFFHLTYCTKIHPTRGWEELCAAIKACVPELKARLAPARPFGLGLRLSDAESRELQAGDHLPRFQDFLHEYNVYVFTLNGFPFGPFRGPSVKARVFAPDWREPARVAYTERLAGILADLLPPGLEGSISTLPLSYKPWLAPDDSRAMTRICANLAGLVRLLRQIREESGRFIHLDLEPEADGLLENSADVVEFFKRWLLPLGGPLLAGWTGLTVSEAQETLLEHIQVCLDACHLAVAFEEPAAVLDRFAAHGIRVGKVQVTSGLKCDIPADQTGRRALAAKLELFSRSPYLHQVMARQEDGTFSSYHDLPEALSRLSAVADRQWRLHFHMPLYTRDYQGLPSTQEETRLVLRLLKDRKFCRHLELETYTWEILPPAMQLNIVDCLEREYRWTMEALGLAS